MARPATITALPTPAKIDSDAEDGDQAGGMFDDDNGIADFEGANEQGFLRTAHGFHPVE